MDRERRLTALPVAYQQMLTWLDEGRSEDEIASGLGVDLRAVAPLCRLARAKLARLAGEAAVDEHGSAFDVANP